MEAMSMESGTRCIEDAEGKERTIAELEDRIRALEDELRSKRGRAEDSLQLMRYMIDQAPDDASLAGPDGRFYYVNDAKCRSLGYTREELLSMHVWDVDPGITEDKWDAAWQYVKRRGFKKFETWHRTKHGQLFLTEVSVTYFDFHGREYVCAFVRDITERKLAEEALRESEEKYRELVENANSIILRFDVRGNLTFFNEYAEKLFGYSKDEVLGRNVVGTIVPLSESTGRNLNDMMEEMKRCPESYHSNINENVCKNGDRVWIAWTNKAIRDQHGNVVEILSVGNDITERKRMEEALRESEEKLRLAIDGAGMGMWDWNIETDVLVWSDRCKKIVGISKDKVLDYGAFLNAIHPGDRERIDRAVKQALDNKEDYGVEMRIPWHDGTVHWAACRGRGLYNKAGKAVRMIGMAVDITDPKRAVEALRVSEERLRRTSRAGEIGLYEWNEDQETVYLSPEAYELFGLEPGSTVTSKKFFARMHPDDREIFRCTSAEARAKAHDGSGVSTQCEFRVLHEDRSVLWLEATAMYALEGGDVMVRGAVRDITERKLAEMALQEKQEKLEVMAEELEVQNEELRTSYEELQRITESLEESESNLARAQAISHIGNWHVDPITGMCSGSDELFRIFGIPQQEKLSISEVIKLVHTDDRAKVRAHYDEAAREHKQSTFDFRIMRPDGEERTIYLDGELTVDGKGRPHMFGTMQDITERKRAEEALRVSEERMRRASRAGQTGLYEWNLDLGTAYLSPEAYELYGLEPCSPMTYEKWLATVHPDDQVKVERTIAVAREKARDTSSISTQVEFRTLHPDGTVLWLLVTATYSIEGGDLIARGAVRDITERKRAEKELWMNKEKFRVLADTSFGMISVHTGGNLLYVNDQAIPLSGYTKDELLKIPFWEIFTEDYRELIKKRAFDRLAGKPGPANYEAKILTKDGKIKWVNMTAGLFLYEDKPAIISTLFDITDSKNAEKELKEAKAQAELYVDLMGHDINNLNHVARGYLELIDSTVEDEKLKKLVSKPMEAIDSSSRLIQNVQKLQREKSGEYMREVLDLGALVEEVAGQMESAPDRHMYINCDAIKGVHVRADELLRDVFVNLVGNAIKHSARSPHIDIRMLTQENDYGEYCRVTIDDNGPGVPDDMKEKIFDRLRRGNTKARGSGLGLYLVKSLVESYGGKVWVEDRVQGDQTKGARFVVELPVA